MIDFHYWPTPNGWKIAIMLEETGLPYKMIPVDIRRGDQHAPAFLAISPNGRMPAIVDHDAPGGPLSIFESGAILLHLAERAGRFVPTDARGRTALMEWLFWQVGNLGPMAGQLSHYVNYAQGEHPYSHRRYAGEYRRCLEVLERRLEGRDYILGGYSIADMASWPWVLIAKPLGQALDGFPNVLRWRAAVKARPAVRRGVDLGKSLRRSAPPTDDERRLLFNQEVAGNHSKKLSEGKELRISDALLKVWVTDRVTLMISFVPASRHRSRRPARPQATKSTAAHLDRRCARTAA